jgi:hypothetical protein
MVKIGIKLLKENIKRLNKINLKLRLISFEINSSSMKRNHAYGMSEIGM